MNAIEMLLELGMKDKMISQNKFVYVPEVMALGKQICTRVHQEVMRLAANPMASCGFCAYAGIGATYVWHNDFASFQTKDVLNLLSEPRGFDCMDEYITDLTGFEPHKLERHLQMASVITIGNTPEAKTAFGKCLITMFNYGMVLELNKLGLH